MPSRYWLLLSTYLVERLHERYLRLLAFITHQYLCVGDALILTAPADRLNKAVSGLLTDCEETLRQEFYQSRQATANLVGLDSRRSAQHIDVLTLRGSLTSLRWMTTRKWSRFGPLYPARK